VTQNRHEAAEKFPAHFADARRIGFADYSKGFAAYP